MNLRDLLKKYDPAGCVLIRAGAVSIGLLVALGIVSDLSDIRGGSAIRAHLEKLPSSVADFEVREVGYGNAYVSFQIKVNQMTEACLIEPLVIELLSKGAPGVNTQVKRVILEVPGKQEEYERRLSVPVGSLTPGSYAISVSPCGGGAPAKLVDFVVLGVRGDP